VNPEAERVALVLHWGGASGRVGLPFAELLPGWRVIAPSLRGHGRKPLPAVPADVSGQDVAKLLAHLGIARLDRLYAYSLGAYVATRLFSWVEIAQAVLLAGGIVPLGVAIPDVFDASAAEPDETSASAWLTAERAKLATVDRVVGDIGREWEMMSDIYEDIFDLSQLRLTFRLPPQMMRPAIESVWHDNYFAAPIALPERLLFWNGNDPDACRPYIEQFTRHPGCREITLDFDPFDVRWEIVRRVIALLEA
jgi:pimeloyl-ACP methyl ester carboxylesterase